MYLHPETDSLADCSFASIPTNAGVGLNAVSENFLPYAHTFISPNYGAVLLAVTNTARERPTSCRCYGA